ncbi:MAG: indole-3-glycerol phosphate synthase TrpC [bacterium]|nr:indole-3-glycerol phosphate synthase TrpC [Acidimicrobiia bacterium]MCY4650635.1 indole-3-glycerol phosphate synthase TrpC [bacterium]
MLDEIIASTQRRIAELKEREGVDPQSPRTARGLASALGEPGLGVIGEVKRRSPSRGVLAAGLDAVEQARIYQQAGASAVSVLTEPDHFGGSNRDLTMVAEAVDIPVLRKDFTLDAAQVWEAARIGADAVLLIVAILDDSRLVELLEASAEAGLAALVEVHNAAEARRAITAGARIVGVNNRDLRDFNVDLATSVRLAPLLGDVEVRIAESGIHTPAQAAQMAEAGYDAVLVGEALVLARSPGDLVSRMRGVTP